MGSRRSVVAALLAAVTGVTTSSCILFYDFEYEEPTSAASSSGVGGASSSSIASTSSSTSSGGDTHLLELTTTDASMDGAERLRVAALASGLDGLFFALGGRPQAGELTLSRPGSGPPITFSGLLGGPAWIVGRWAPDGGFQASVVDTFPAGTPTSFDVASSGVAVLYGITRPNALEWGQFVAGASGITRTPLVRCTGPLEGVSVDIRSASGIVASTTTNASQIVCFDVQDQSPIPSCDPGAQPGVGRDIVYWVLGNTGGSCLRTGFVGDDCATSPTPACDPSFDTLRPVARLSGPAGPASPTHAWIGGSVRGPLVGTALVGALPGGSDFVLQTPLAAFAPTESALFGGSAADRPLVLGQRDGAVVGLFSGEGMTGHALELYGLGGAPASLGSAGTTLVRRGLMTTPDAMPSAGIVGGAIGRCAPTFTNVDDRGCAAPAMVDPTSTDSDGFWATMEPNGVVLGATFGTSGRNEITAGAWVTADELVLAGLADSAAFVGGATLSSVPVGTSRVFLTRFAP